MREGFSPTSAAIACNGQAYPAKLKALTGDMPDEVVPLEAEICMTEAETLIFWRNNCKFAAGHLISHLFPPVAAKLRRVRSANLRFALASRAKALPQGDSVHSRGSHRFD